MFPEHAGLLHGRLWDFSAIRRGLQSRHWTKVHYPRRPAPPKIAPMFGQSLLSRKGALPLIAVGLLACGCGKSAEQAVEQTAEQTYEVDPNGAFSFRNATGSIRIAGSDDAGMKVRTTKKAWSGEQLSAIAARVSVQSQSASIETSFPPQKTWRFHHLSGSVNYVISLPRTVRISRLDLENGNILIDGMRGDVRADLVNGELVARNCFGTVQLSVANGGLELAYEKWQQRPFAVDARIIGGNARIFLPRAASFHLLAETAKGNVSNHFARPEEQDSRKATRVNMSIGPEPRPEINLRVTNGDIEIAAAKAN
jgi:hypothetical protein